VNRLVKKKRVLLLDRKLGDYSPPSSVFPEKLGKKEGFREKKRVKAGGIELGVEFVKKEGETQASYRTSSSELVGGEGQKAAREGGAGRFGH